MARLKVFITSDGLTDFVVAATSKAKALAAWGIRQDIFKEGLARETDDKSLTKAASARPGEVLRRPAGTRAELARVKHPKRVKLSGPTRGELKKISDLEAKIAALDAGHEAAAQAIEQRRATLDREEETLHADHEARRGKLQAALSAARSAPG